MRSADSELVRFLHPTAPVQVVDSHGRSCLPTRCSKAEDHGMCTFVQDGFDEALKPLLQAEGPVFLRVRRYLCKVHDGVFKTKPSFARLLPPETQLMPFMLRVGKASV